MQVISRPRNSGKTTILLHYMVLEPWAVYVARTEDEAARVFRLSETLGLHLDKTRFMGMCDTRIQKGSRHTFLVDDADYILERHDIEGYKVINCASIITISEGKQNG